MMEEFRGLVERIREQFPSLDVRTDQGNIIRILTKGGMVGILREGDEYKAQFISFEDDCDFETTLTKTVASRDFSAFQEEVLESLGGIPPVRQKSA